MYHFPKNFINKTNKAKYMITTMEYKDEKIVKDDLKDITSPKTFNWVDVVEPTKEELKTIASITKIPIHHLHMAVEEEERPKVVEIDGPFSLLIFGAPSFEEDEITTTPVFMYISKQHNYIITIRKRDAKSISKLKNSEKINSFFDKGPSYFTYRLMDAILSAYFDVLDDVEDIIDKIEDKVLKEPDIHIVEKIFETKKTLIYFTKTMTANREVISSIERGYVHEIDKRRAPQFIALYNDTVQLVDMSTTFREILTGTLDTYLSSVSNNLNHIMKTLTVGASFVLIPTLIASVYGMNFKVMPELYWKYGYVFSIGLMVVSSFAIWLFFKKKKWV